MRRPLLPAAALAALLAAPASAVDINDGQLSIHADGQWAYQKTSGGNSYDGATPAGNYDTAMFDVVLTARPAADLVISAQLGFDPEGTELEWGFAEWRFSEKLRLRVGKVQQPFGNLNELRFAGTTRPFYHLPYAVYGPANVVGTAYLGLGATGQVSSDGGWGLAYDLYGGAVTLGESEPYALLKNPSTPDGPVAFEEQQVRDLVGGRLSLVAPSEITLRLSGYAGRIDHEGETDSFSSLGVSVQYRGEALWLSAEAFRSSDGDSELAWTAYGSVGYMLTEHLQVAAQYEWARTTFAGSPESALLRHDSFGLGLAWWANPSLVFKACWHRIDGNRFAYPDEATYGSLVDPATAPSPRTDAFTLGTQFAF
jgi:opacity protein-like surface antigen